MGIPSVSDLFRNKYQLLPSRLIKIVAALQAKTLVHRMEGRLMVIGREEVSNIHARRDV